MPDGDTGTNMFLTVESARDALVAALAEHPGDLRAGLQGYSRGALLGARGNSGVILSQLVGALFRRIGQAGPDDRSATVFAEGMALATEVAYSAVGEPVEGTILSVARAASEAATEFASTGRVGSAMSCTPLPRPPARLSPVRRSSCRCSRGQESSTPVVAACASCWTRPSRRSPASR